MDFFREPFAYEFFRNGFVAAVLVGALCGVMGVYIVLRRMSYIGHGLSHSVFGGAVVSFLFGINFFLGAGAWGFLSAVLINAAGRRRNIGSDAAIGIITTASFALGVALVSKDRSLSKNFEALLFGNILAVDAQDLLVVGGVTIAVALAIFVAFKQLVFVTFDADMARIHGVRVSWIDAGFSMALAATIVASLNVVGVTLIAAAIVVPPTTARLLTDSFGKLMLLSLVIGAAGGGLGMFASYHFDVASGAAIVLLLTAVFVAVYAGTSLRNALRTRQPRAQEVEEAGLLPARPMLATAHAGHDDNHFD
jgi:ABC-type Mn2+/Zn2+ transport system permease subunit